MKFTKYLIAAVLMMGFGQAQAALISHAAADFTGALTPAGGALADPVGDFFADAGHDYSFGNVEGVFSDPPEAFCGINANGDCDLVTAVDAAIVGGLADSIFVEAGFSNAGSLLLEIFDNEMNLLDSAVNGPPLGPNGRQTFSLDRGGTRDIAFWRVSGDDTFGVNFVEIDRIAAVPAPGTLLLLGLGLLGLRFLHRRRAA